MTQPSTTMDSTSTSPMGNHTDAERFAGTIRDTLTTTLHGVEDWIAEAYQLVPVTKQGKEEPTTTTKGTYEDPVMPFGLTNVPKTFQALVRDTLEPQAPKEPLTERS